MARRCGLPATRQRGKTYNMNGEADSSLSQNLELKARCADLTRARDTALKLGAIDTALLRQIDTYFRVDRGRLKIRQIEETDRQSGEQTDRAELIWYDRPDRDEARVCQYRVVPIDDAESHLQVLDLALGTRGTIRKIRHLLMWHNVRIHLDAVEGLGSFVEFEAVIAGGPGREEQAPAETSATRLATLRSALQIEPRDLIDRSYS